MRIDKPLHLQYHECYELGSAAALFVPLEKLNTYHRRYQ